MVLDGYLVQGGNALVDGDTCTGVGAIGDARSDVLCTIGNLLDRKSVV